jgi:hypothetical protein
LTLAGAFATGAQAAPQYSRDYDRDGIPDREELRYNNDYDRDGVPDREEFRYRNHDRFSDVAIDRRVTRALFRELGHDATDIDVRVRNGDVVLSGTVDRPVERRQARIVASNVPGVRAVYARNLFVRYR